MKQKTSAHKRSVINGILTVKQCERLSINLIRVIFNCDKKIEFDPLWIGPHAKLLFPSVSNDDIIFPQTNEDNKIIWANGTREQVRTYSIRNYNQDNNVVVIDFVVHESGIATQWAQQANVGDNIGLIAMGAKNRFDNNKQLILIGDIAAMPAICYTLEHLPQGQKALAIIEVRDEKDKLPLTLTQPTELIWLVTPQGHDTKLISQLTQSVSTVDQENALFWGGMESSIAQSIRRFLKEHFTALPSDSIHLISYWREGFAEGQFKHHD
ncbi:siderophore-interacting protein [Orbus sturtevantii]|uniref:siderophore-interacting protein n=1 Tax=Orbus sturtevantii TaxID=3074109 RepID=UPI00370D2EDF